MHLGRHEAGVIQPIEKFLPHLFLHVTGSPFAIEERVCSKLGTLFHLVVVDR